MGFSLDQAGLQAQRKANHQSNLLARAQVIGDSNLWSVIGSEYYVREDWVAGTMAEGQWHAQSSCGGVASSLIFGNAFVLKYILTVLSRNLNGCVLSPLIHSWKLEKND